MLRYVSGQIFETLTLVVRNLVLYETVMWGLFIMLLEGFLRVVTSS